MELLRLQAVLGFEDAEQASLGVPQRGLTDLGKVQRIGMTGAGKFFINLAFAALFIFSLANQ